MKAEELSSGYYVMADNRFVKRYDGIGDCRSHIKYQKEQMQSTAKWQIAKAQIKIEIIENEKEQLIKAIEDAFNNTTNTCKKVTLSNYYNTIKSLSESEIDYDWYYNQLKSFGC